MSAKTRGCGERQRGGLYVEVGSEEGDTSILELIVDPMRSIDPKEIGVTPRGVHLVELDGVNHIVDIVGAKHYPTPAHFVEEMVRLGISRRISKTFPFEKLDPSKSRLILLHRRAFVQGQDVGYQTCPKGVHASTPGHPECSGAWWVTIPEDELTPSAAPSIGTVTLANGATFNAVKETGDEAYSYGVIAICPIERFGGVYDPEGNALLDETISKLGSLGFVARMEEL